MTRPSASVGRPRQPDPLPRTRSGHEALVPRLLREHDPLTRGQLGRCVLRLPHGVGGGLVMAGTLHRGAHGVSGMFGHITVDPDGAPCECGGTGCLETVASIGAVLDAYRNAGGVATTQVAELMAVLAAGDRTAHAVPARVGARIGKVLGDVCLSLGPDVIVVGGELVDAGPALLEPIERELNAEVRRGSWPPLRVRPAGLGHAATALGAISLLQRQSPVPPRYSVHRTGVAAPG
ncbi:ROK family protein [Streptomyces sp. 6N106]|uniref:ROK family protein n=1 Tax=Streptomyces sp. 6N106 TaxID=3457418 RepID=UPI003FD1470B